MVKTILRLLVAGIVLCAPGVALSQHYYLEASFRGSVLLESDILKSDHPQLIKPALAMTGELLFFPRPWIGFGGFCGRGLTEASYRNFKHELGFNYYGITAQVRTSNSKTFQYYALIRGAKYDRVVVYENEKYTYDVGEGISAGVGLNLRLGKIVKINLIELSCVRFSEDTGITDRTPSYWVQAQSGISFSFFRRR